MGLGIRAYARRWGVHHRAIQHAIETGLIVRQPDGSIDPDQADAGWGELHLARLRPPTTPVALSEVEIAAGLDELARRDADPDIDALLLRVLRRQGAL